MQVLWYLIQIAIKWLYYTIDLLSIHHQNHRNLVICLWRDFLDAYDFLLNKTKVSKCVIKLFLAKITYLRQNVETNQSLAFQAK